jgi:hypothetical protein
MSPNFSSPKPRKPQLHGKGDIRHPWGASRLRSSLGADAESGNAESGTQKADAESGTVLLPTQTNATQTQKAGLSCFRRKRTQRRKRHAGRRKRDSPAYSETSRIVRSSRLSWRVIRDGYAPMKYIAACRAGVPHPPEAGACRAGVPDPAEAG